MKKSYKELQKNLQDSYIQPKGDYYIAGSVGEWLTQSGIEPTEEKLRIIYKIHGAIPYPNNPKDRKEILNYLKSTKYKEFKGDNR